MSAFIALIAAMGAGVFLLLAIAIDDHAAKMTCSAACAVNVQIFCISLIVFAKTYTPPRK